VSTRQSPNACFHIQVGSAVGLRFYDGRERVALVYSHLQSDTIATEQETFGELYFGEVASKVRASMRDHVRKAWQSPSYSVHPSQSIGHKAPRTEYL